MYSAADATATEGAHRQCDDTGAIGANYTGRSSSSRYSADCQRRTDGHWVGARRSMYDGELRAASPGHGHRWSPLELDYPL